MLYRAQECPGCDVWGSIPCGSWSALQRLNVLLHGESYSQELAAKRRKSKQLLRNFLLLARQAKRMGGDVHFEWPAYNDGWKLPEIGSMIEEFGMEHLPAR